MADVAKRLCGPLALDATARTYYTVPTATTAIIRNIHVTCNSALTYFYMSIGTFAQATAIFNGYPIAGGGAMDWSGFMVMAAGETIQIKADQNVQLTVTISGVEVS